MSQQIPEIQGSTVDVKDNATGKAKNSLVQLVSLMLIKESVMGKTDSQSPGELPAKKSKVKRGRDDQEEASDEEGRLSAEESTIAGSLTVSPILSCSAPSLDTDAEDLSDLDQNEHAENGFESLNACLQGKNESLNARGDVNGFRMVAQRLAGVFAELDETSLEDDGDELSEFGDDKDGERVDVMQWQEVGKRLSSLAWLNMEDSDLDD